MSLLYLQLESLRIHHSELFFQISLFLRQLISLRGHRDEGRFLGCQLSLSIRVDQIRPNRPPTVTITIHLRTCSS